MADFNLLHNVELSEDLEWIDEYSDGSDLVAHDERVSVRGKLIIQASAQYAGRKITLQGRMETGNVGFAAVPLATITALRALAAVAGAQYQLTLVDGRQFTVVFRRDDGPAVEAEPLRHIVPHESTDLWFPTIRLMQV